MKPSNHHSGMGVLLSYPLLGLVVAACLGAGSEPGSGLAPTVDENPPYTAIVVAPPGTSVPAQADPVTIAELLTRPERHVGEYVQVQGYYLGEQTMEMMECWIAPPWQWSLGDGLPQPAPGGLPAKQPPMIDVANLFGDALQMISDEKGNTVRNPYWKEVVVRGWWRRHDKLWGCPETLGLAGIPPHWYLDAVQLQFLESIEVVRPQEYEPIRAVEVSGSSLYVGAESMLTTLDIGQPANPQLLGQIAIPGPVADIYVEGDQVYVLYARTSQASGGLHILDVSDPFSPLLLSTLPLEGTPVDLSAASPYLFVANVDLGLQIVDATHPTDPVLFGRCGTPMHLVQAVGNRIYAGGAGLEILDLSGQGCPTRIGVSPLETDLSDFVIERDLAYLLVNVTGLRILDISDAAQPRLLSASEEEGEYRSLAVEGDRAYVVRFGELEIYDVSDPTRPSRIGTMHLADGVAVRASGNTAFVATWQYGLQILDVSDPTSQVLLHTYGSPRPADN